MTICRPIRNEETYFFDSLDDEQLDKAIDTVLDMVKNNSSLSEKEKIAISALIKMGLFIQHPEAIGDLDAFRRIIDHLNKKRSPELQIPLSMPTPGDNSDNHQSSTSHDELCDIGDDETSTSSNSSEPPDSPEPSNEADDPLPSDNSSEPPASPEPSNEGDDPLPSNNSSESSSSPEPNGDSDKKKKGGRKKGQGNRRKCEQVITIRIAVDIDKNVAPGESCPCGCGGKLYSHQNYTSYVVTGSPILNTQAYDLETTRCSECRTLFRAKLPDELGKVDPKNGWTSGAKTMAALTRFWYGMPATRLESFQDVCGTFVSDTQLHSVCKDTYETLLPLWEEMQKFFTDEADFQIVDDGYVHVIEEKQKLKELPKGVGRSGNFVTAGYGYSEDKKVFVFKTSSFHMGEKLLEWDFKSLRKKKVIRLMDGSSCGTIDSPSTLQLALGTFENFGGGGIDWERPFSVEFANCWQHVRTHLKEAVDAPIKEIEDLLSDISDLFKAHKKWECADFSKKLEDSLRNNVSSFFQKVRGLAARKIIEPNSKYSSALNYILNREENLQVFLDYPGLPMETNIVERAIKMHHRYNHNSLHFNNLAGANVGDFFMSLFHTANAYGMNSYEYLKNLIEFSDEVSRSPQSWLPWSYEVTLKKAREERALKKSMDIENNTPRYDIPHRVKSDKEMYPPFSHSKQTPVEVELKEASVLQ